FDLRRHLAEKSALRHFRFTIKIAKSPITQKRNEIERKLLLITNRKSMIAFQNQLLYFTCDDTWRRKRRFVTSGLPQNREKSRITQKRYEMEQKLLLITNMKSVIAYQNPVLYFTC